MLAYIPQSNTWIMVECKYNQTPYCLQDMKRLRNRVIDEGRKTHVPKILKRYDFLVQNHHRICEILGYSLNTETNPKIIKILKTVLVPSCSTLLRLKKRNNLFKKLKKTL